MPFAQTPTAPHKGLSRCAAVLCVVTFWGCAATSQLEKKIADLRLVTTHAQRNGAQRCAPEELALAQSHLDFAETELAQGFGSKARHHVWVAEPNAHAAVLLSPPEVCSPHAAAAISDQDGDGLQDELDRCRTLPEAYNALQDDDGCPDALDSDGDDRLEPLDACPLEAEDLDGYLDDDGCPEFDNDLDTIADQEDRCLLDPEDLDSYEDADGCPEPDNDQDGVPDGDDGCPNEVGPANASPAGCPRKALALVTDCEVRITEQIHFAYNQADIRRESFATLDAVVEILEKNPTIRLEVQGHTDDRGGAAYNLDLSNRRAASVVKYLAARGVSAARLTSRGYGLERPLVENSDARSRALNRRVQFLRAEAEQGACQVPQP